MEKEENILFLDNLAVQIDLMDDKNVRILKLPLKYFLEFFFGGRIQVVFQNVKCSFVFRLNAGGLGERLCQQVCLNWFFDQLLGV